LNLKQLQYFRLLAKKQHYTQTAEELYISQPALSRTISELEKELGTYLFEKEGRNVILTKYGRFFLQYIERGLAEIETGEMKLKEMVSPQKEVIDLGFIYTLGPTFIPKVVSQFRSTKGCKDMTFQFHQGLTPALIKGLLDHKYDLVFCSNLDNEPNIEYYPLLEQELVVIAAHHHPLAQFDFVTLEEIIEYPLVQLSDKTGFMDNLFHKAGLTPKIACYVEEDTAMACLVASNFGIAITPENEVHDKLNVKSIKIIEPIIRPFYIATVRNRYLPPAPEKFLHFMLDNLKKNAV
jgi:DNA-binding transcriptional LysR family regulator